MPVAGTMFEVRTLIWSIQMSQTITKSDVDGCRWTVYGFYMGCIWIVYGLYMDYRCTVYGLYIRSSFSSPAPPDPPAPLRWTVYGLYMDCRLTVDEMYMDCIWTVYGL